MFNMGRFSNLGIRTTFYFGGSIRFPSARTGITCACTWVPRASRPCPRRISRPIYYNGVKGKYIIQTTDCSKIVSDGKLMRRGITPDYIMWQLMVRKLDVWRGKVWTYHSVYVPYTSKGLEVTVQGEITFLVWRLLHKCHSLFSKVGNQKDNR